MIEKIAYILDMLEDDYFNIISEFRKRKFNEEEFIDELGLDDMDIEYSIKPGEGDEDNWKSIASGFFGFGDITIRTETKGKISKEQKWINNFLDDKITNMVLTPIEYIDRKIRVNILNPILNDDDIWDKWWENNSFVSYFLKPSTKRKIQRIAQTQLEKSLNIEKRKKSNEMDFDLLFQYSERELIDFIRKFKLPIDPDSHNSRKSLRNAIISYYGNLGLKAQADNSIRKQLEGEL